MASLITRRYVVHGTVQGVGYRYSTYYAAIRYGVKGWVRNRRDGTVEIMAQGDESAIAEFYAWIQKGPDLAQVNHVDQEPGSGNFSDFTVAETL